jgi:hypothetical protein
MEEVKTWFQPKYQLLADKKLIIMMQCGTLKPTENKELVEITWSENYIQLFNAICDTEKKPDLKLSQGVPMLASQLELLFNWLGCSIDKEGQTSFGKILVTGDGTPLTKVKVVEKEVEVIKKVVETKIIKQQIRAELDKATINKKADKFLRAHTKEMNGFQADIAKESVLKFIAGLK